MSAPEDETVGEGTHETEGSEAEESPRFVREFAHLTAKAVGRTREGGEDILAEARGVRQEDPSVFRRTAVYGLASLLRAGDLVAARARDVAAQARAVQAGARDASRPSSDMGASQDASGTRPDAAEKTSPTAPSAPSQPR